MGSRRDRIAATGALATIRVMRLVSGSVNGVRLGRLRVGECYVVPAPVAWYLETVGAGAIESDHSRGERRSGGARPDQEKAG